MSGGYDPRKRGWYETANRGQGRIMITDAFASTVGATVVGITRHAYDSNGEFIGNASIEVALDTLTRILENMNFGEGSFTMMIQEDGVILADTSEAKNNFKSVDDIGIPGLRDFLNSENNTGKIEVNGKEYLVESVQNRKTGYHIIVCSAKDFVFAPFYQTLKIIIILCSIFGVIVAVAIAVVTRKTIYPLKVIRDGISETAEQIANGNANLKKRISINSDNEIGDVASSFNMFSEKLLEIIGSMKQSKMSLNEAGSKLGRTTADAMSAISQINSSIQNYLHDLKNQSSSVEQTSQSVTKILESIHSLEKQVSDQAKEVLGASGAVEQMLSNINSVNTSVDKMAQSFGSLEVNAQNGAKTQKELQLQITEIEKQSNLLSEANAVIANIAEQTNLLAMNAAIEAAHAGEAGKGFAVVAGEIRKLSTTSSAQSKTIGEQLKNISSTIEMVVKTTQNGVEDYAHLESEIHETNTLVQQIKEAIAEQKTGSAQITNALYSMNSGFQTVQKASKDMADDSNIIMEQVAALQQKTSDMKNGMDEMGIGAEKINATGDALSEISTLMDESISEIGRQVDQFEL